MSGIVCGSVGGGAINDTLSLYFAPTLLPTNRKGCPPLSFWEKMTDEFSLDDLQDFFDTLGQGAQPQQPTAAAPASTPAPTPVATEAEAAAPTPPPPASSATEVGAVQPAPPPSSASAFLSEAVPSVDPPSEAAQDTSLQESLNRAGLTDVVAKQPLPVPPVVVADVEAPAAAWEAPVVAGPQVGHQEVEAVPVAEAAVVVSVVAQPPPQQLTAKEQVAQLIAQQQAQRRQETPPPEEQVAQQVQVPQQVVQQVQTPQVPQQVVEQVPVVRPQGQVPQQSVQQVPVVRPQGPQVPQQVLEQVPVVRPQGPQVPQQSVQQVPVVRPQVSQAPVHAEQSQPGNETDQLQQLVRQQQLQITGLQREVQDLKAQGGQPTELADIRREMRDNQDKVEAMVTRVQELLGHVLMNQQHENLQRQVHQQQQMQLLQLAPPNTTYFPVPDPEPPAAQPAPTSILTPVTPPPQQTASVKTMVANLPIGAKAQTTTTTATTAAAAPVASPAPTPAAAVSPPSTTAAEKKKAVAFNLDRNEYKAYYETVRAEESGAVLTQEEQDRLMAERLQQKFSDEAQGVEEGRGARHARRSKQRGPTKPETAARIERANGGQSQSSWSLTQGAPPHMSDEDYARALQAEADASGVGISGIASIQDDPSTSQHQHLLPQDTAELDDSQQSTKAESRARGGMTTMMKNLFGVPGGGN